MFAKNSESIAATTDEQLQLRALANAATAEPNVDGVARLISASGHEYVLPEPAVRVLTEAARVLARGDAVAVVPLQQELTTQGAADLLNVSRQYLVRLLDQGTIPCHKVGTHRRIAVGDLLRYKRQRDLERQHGLAELARLSQELGLYE